nr:RecName: Full=Alkaline protease Gr3 [Clonostachys rosea]
ATQSNAP